MKTHLTCYEIYQKSISQFPSEVDRKLDNNSCVEKKKKNKNKMVAIAKFFLRVSYSFCCCYSFVAIAVVWVGNLQVKL